MTDYDPFASDYTTENMDSESVHEGGGGGVQLEGRYHVIVEPGAEYIQANVAGSDKDDDDYARSLPHYKMQLRVLAGENPSEAGKKIYHRIWLGSWKDGDADTKDAGQINPLNERGFEGVLALLHAFGVVGDEIFGQKEVRISLDMLQRLENTQAVVKVSMSEERTNAATGKTYKPSAQMWNNDAWPLNHEKVADVPKDHEHAQYQSTGAASDDDMDDI